MEEKETYLERVRNWRGGDRSALRPRMDDPVSAYQNVLAAATAWSDAEVKAFNEGSVLVTALVGIAESGWLPDNIYIKSAKRAIRFITSALDNINAQYAGVKFPRQGEPEPRIAYFGEGAADTSKVTGLMKDAKAKQAEAFVAAMEQEKTGNAQTREEWLARPKHLDQYMHLLPKETQEKAAGIKGLFMQLDQYRENARLLMENPHADRQTIAQWAAKATKTDEKIKAIFKEVDTEWEKVAKSGKIVVDEFGVAHAVEGTDRPTPDRPTTDPSRDGGETSGEGTADNPGNFESTENQEQKNSSAPALPAADATDTVAGEKPKRKRATKAEMVERRKKEREEELMKMSEEEKAKRREYLKKWLRDTRTAKSPKHDEQWLWNCHELVLLGGEVTEAIRKAAAYYELEIPAEWMSPSSGDGTNATQG